MGRAFAFDETTALARIGVRPPVDEKYTTRKGGLPKSIEEKTLGGESRGMQLKATDGSSDRQRANCRQFALDQNLQIITESRRREKALFFPPCYVATMLFTLMLLAQITKPPEFEEPRKFETSAAGAVDGSSHVSAERAAVNEELLTILRRLPGFAEGVRLMEGQMPGAAQVVHHQASTARR